MIIEFQSEKPDRVTMHYNKANLTDPTIPMWTVKHKGQTYYVHQLNSTLGFNTKQTPDSDHTKGSIQFNKASLRIEEENGQRTALIS